MVIPLLQKRVPKFIFNFMNLVLQIHRNMQLILSIYNHTFIIFKYGHKKHNMLYLITY